MSATVCAATVSGCSESLFIAGPAGGVGVVGIGDGEPCTRAAAAAKPVWLVGSGMAAMSGCCDANTSKSCKGQGLKAVATGQANFGSPVADAPLRRDPSWICSDSDLAPNPFLKLESLQNRNSGEI